MPNTIPTYCFLLGNVLGSGAFGIVRKAEAVGIIEKGVKTTVAVKVAKRHHDSLFIKALVSELKIMIYLGQHPNVVNLLGACTKDLINGMFSNFSYMNKMSNSIITSIPKE